MRARVDWDVSFLVECLGYAWWLWPAWGVLIAAWMCSFHARCRELASALLLASGMSTLLLNLGASRELFPWSCGASPNALQVSWWYFLAPIQTWWLAGGPLLWRLRRTIAAEFRQPAALLATLTVQVHAVFLGTLGLMGVSFGKPETFFEVLRGLVYGILVP